MLSRPPIGGSLRPVLAVAPLALALAVALACCKQDAPPPAADVERIDGGRLGQIALFRPDDPPEALVFLFSDASGWSPAFDAAADSLSDDGAAVVGVDLPSYEKGLRASDDGCHYADRRDRGALAEASASARHGRLSQSDSRRCRRGRDARVRGARAVAGGNGGGRGERRSRAVARYQGAVLSGRAVRLPCAGKGFAYGAQADLPGWWLVSSRTPLAPDLASLVDDVDEPPPVERRAARSPGRAALAAVRCRGHLAGIAQSAAHRDRGRSAGLVDGRDLFGRRWLAGSRQGDRRTPGRTQGAGRGCRFAPLLLEREDTRRDRARPRRDSQRVRRQMGDAQGRAGRLLVRRRRAAVRREPAARSRCASAWCWCRCSVSMRARRSRSQSRAGSAPNPTRTRRW